MVEWDFWAELYDLEHEDWTKRDLPFYLAEACATSPVLELACATGRLMIPIAKAGVPIVGIDYSREMLDRARAKSTGLDNIQFILGRMEDFEIKERFGLIFISYSGFLALKTVQAQERTLYNVRRHLRAGGRLIMDMFTPSQDEIGAALENGQSVGMRLVHRLHHPQTGHVSLIWQAVSHVPNEQTFHADRVIHTFDSMGISVGDSRYAYMSGRYIYRFEMQHLLRICGFKSIELYGGYNHEPFDPSSKRMVWVASVT